MFSHSLNRLCKIITRLMPTLAIRAKATGTPREKIKEKKKERINLDQQALKVPIQKAKERSLKGSNKKVKETKISAPSPIKIDINRM